MINVEATARPGHALSNGAGPYPESAYSFCAALNPEYTCRSKYMEATNWRCRVFRR